MDKMFDNLDISVKSVIGVILLIICFIYILRRPGMSMMDNLKEHQKKQMEKEQRVREALEKAEETRSSDEADGADTQAEPEDGGNSGA